MPTSGVSYKCCSFSQYLDQDCDGNQRRKNMIRFEYRAWRILPVAEKMVGFWPYQNKLKNFALRIFDASVVLTLIFGLMVKLVKEWNHNLHIVVENFIILITALVILIKVVTMCTIDERRKRMFQRITKHFEIVLDEDEVQILRDYSEKGLIFTVLAILAMVIAIAIYLAMPIARMFCLFFFGNGMLEKRLPVYIDFLVDDQEYFVYIVAFVFFILSYGAVFDFAFDLNFFLIVRHICALFQIIKLRLDRASKILEQCDENNKLSKVDESKAYEILSSAVDLHNEASELTELLDEAYNVTWFFILLLNAIALAPIPVMTMLYKHDTFESCRRFMAFIVYPLHFYIIFVQGQMTIDYSESVFDSCYEFHWYNAPKRFRLAVSIMMIRTLRPCRLTGVLFDLSMETYAVMLKTALSYVSMIQALFL